MISNTTYSSDNFFSQRNAYSYRYEFQGQEMDDEIKGEGNNVNFTYRMYDPRLGRFFAIDPLTMDYPELTPYQFSSNRTTDFIELEGLEGTKALALERYSEGFSDAIYSNLLFGIGRENAEEKYPKDLYAQKAFIQGQMAGDVLSLVTGGIEISMGTGSLGVSGTLLFNIEGAIITAPGAAIMAIKGAIEIVHGTTVTTHAGAGLITGIRQLSAVDKKIAAKEAAEKNELPDDTPVVRGGSNTPEAFEKGTGVHSKISDKSLDGISVNSSSGKNVKDLSKGIPHGKIGVTTVGDIRKAGGNVVPSPTKSNPNHATMSIPSAGKASEIMKVTKNPHK